MKRFFSAVIVTVMFLAGCQSEQPAPALTTTASTSAPTPALTAAPTALPTVTRTSLQPSPTSAPPSPTPEPPATTPEPPTATPTPAPNDVWVNGADLVNLRAEASVTATVVTQVKLGQHLIALGPAVGPDASANTWQKVRMDDEQTGWVSAQYLSTTRPYEVWINETDGVNLRVEASVTATVITRLAFAQHLLALGPTVGPDAGGYTWQNVRTDDGQTGWVSAQYLSRTPPAVATPSPNDVWINETAGVNLRVEASVTATVITRLAFAQHLLALGPAVGPDAGGYTWQNVRTDDGQTGWVSAQYLSRTPPAVATPIITPTSTMTPTATITPTSAMTPTSTMTPASTIDVWVIAEKGLNLRAQAAVTSALVTTLSFQQHLTLIGSRTAPDATGITWQNVRTDDGKIGWVDADFLSATPPTPTPTATATMPPR